MSDSSTSKDEAISDRRDLVRMLEAGSKPASAWRIGTEHEKFGFRRDDLRPPPYQGERGIESVLRGFTAFGWAQLEEKGRLIALVRDGASITLEPAGQLELSGAPFETLHDTAAELDAHFSELDAVAKPLELGFLGLGFQPKWAREDMPWMPKGRYTIMRNYMPKVGQLGLDMMTRTCTVQVNLDFASEADMAKKFRVALALQPIATALFANSPFTQGRPNGYLSYRSHIWTDTDPDRTGMLDFVFDEGFGFERYVDYLLDVPMYFVYRDGRYIDVAGRSFRRFMDGKLDELPGQSPTLRDFSDHMTTAFPEVRLKTYLEMRGADAGPKSHLAALPAFWVGLLYDDASLDAAWDLVRDFSLAERHALRDGVPRHGLVLPFRSGSVKDLAQEALRISAAGLARRSRVNANGADETSYLDPLFRIALEGRTAAEHLLQRFEQAWNGNIDHVFTEAAY
jgi:glutamate--cysteine ligase